MKSPVESSDPSAGSLAAARRVIAPVLSVILAAAAWNAFELLRVIRRSFVIVAAAALVLVQGCSHERLLRNSFEVIESGIEVHDTSSVFWVSSDELVFSAWTDEHVMDGSFRKRRSRVTTWNLRTNEKKRYAPIDGGLCYDNGSIAYREVENAALRDWTTLGRLSGPMTREPRAIRYDELTCLPYDALPQPPARDVEHVFVRLRPEHGFIDLGPQRSIENAPIKLYAPGSSRGVELPFKRREFERGTIKYFPFKGAYFIVSSYFDAAHGYGVSPWPQGVPRPVWWLHPDGTVEEIIISPTAWMRESIVPTATGLLAISNAFFTITGEPPTDGVYLIEGTRSRRLMRGVLEATDVSPGGCGFAVRRQPEPGVRRPAYWTITVLSLCKEAT
jgi:hypothetical protein